MADTGDESFLSQRNGDIDREVDRNACCKQVGDPRLRNKNEKTRQVGDPPDGSRFCKLDDVFRLPG